MVFLCIPVVTGRARRLDVLMLALPRTDPRRHWRNNTKESEKITFGDVMTAESLIENFNAKRKRMSRVFIAAGLLILASQVLRI